MLMLVRNWCVVAARLSTPPIVLAVGVGNCEGAAAPLMSVNAGCAADGVPPLSMPVMKK